jgi:hypothetical protein
VCGTAGELLPPGQHGHPRGDSVAGLDARSIRAAVIAVVPDLRDTPSIQRA